MTTMVTCDHAAPAFTPGVFPDRQQWGRVLKRAVLAAGLTQAEVAEKMHAPLITVWRKLNGLSPLYIGEVFELAKITGTRAEDLCMEVQALAEAEAGIVR